jgi:hypothetical protein
VLPIPYEAQERPDGCAAAALGMVYRSLGLECTQAELWPRVSALVRGARRGRTHLIGRDAQSCGLAAVVFRPASPWEALRGCDGQGVRVILHHRLSASEPAGHYSVLVAIDEASLLLHDPLRGPGRRLGRDEFLALWSPSAHSGEVAGHILVAVSASPGEPRCSFCHSPCPESIDCAGCGSALRLRPSAAVGCLDPTCPGRRFEVCFCPWCDMSTWWLQGNGRGTWLTSMRWWRN